MSALPRRPLVLALVVAAACGSDKSSTKTLALDAVGTADPGTLSAQAGLESASDAASTSADGSGNATQRALTRSRAYANRACVAAAVSNLMVDPQNSADVDVSLTLTYTNCPWRQGRTRSGTSAISFSGSLLTGDGQLTVTNQIAQTDAHGKTTISGDPSLTVTTSATSASVETLVLTGAEHRVRTEGDKTTLDVVVTHNSLKAALDSSAGTLTLNGTSTVRHNLEKVTATLTYTDVQSTPGGAANGCCHPTSGTLAQHLVADDGTVVDRTYTFSASTCGEVGVTSGGVSSTVTWAACD